MLVTKIHLNTNLHTDCSKGGVQGGFYYYSGMTKPTNQETMVTEMILYNSQFPRGGNTL